MIAGNIFREYDIRGNADGELTDRAVRAIGRAYGTWLRERGVEAAALGGDVRLSTPRLKADVTEGLRSVGVDVEDVGTVTTPMLYWSLRHLGLRGGVMVTGSHNPPEMNGLKLCWDRGTLWGDEVQEIRRIVEAGNFSEGRGALRYRDVDEAYLAMLTARFQPFSRRFKVVCDSGNGTAGPLIRRFLSGLGCEVTALFEQRDGNFPNHHPDPQKRENLQDLIDAVRTTGADVGFAFDGDADRLGVVDERGEVLWGDRLMALYWREILAKHPGADAIVEPKCSMALPEDVERHGGRVVYWKSGHSVIKAKMRSIGALFAGELSGHMFFADEYYGFDDSFYAAARLLRILSASGRTLSELTADIPLYPATDEVRIPCPDDRKFATVDRIRKAALKDHEALTLDGVRILYPDGWGLIRASNTQPVLTVRCEGRDEAALERVKADVRRRLLAEGLPDFRWL